MATSERKDWTRDHLLLTLHLYWRIPFGQQHARNPQVIELANALGRTANSVAMKLNNFSALDPIEAARKIKGLHKTSALDRAVWQEFTEHHAEVAPESEALWRTRVEGLPGVSTDATEQAPIGPTEVLATRRTRRGQDFFRRVVLANFGGRCALTGVASAALVNASHIVAWADDDGHRLDAANGIALNRLHDAAFDQKLITFDDAFRLVVGPRVREVLSEGELSRGFLAYEGRPLAKPARHSISLTMLARHRREFERINA